MKKKIYKALSVLLTLVIVFSACICVFNTVSAATDKTYYVKSGGDDANDGSTKRKAVKTLDKIIQLANAAGLGEGDTVTALVLDTTNVKWKESGDVLTAHDFKLIVKSENEDGSAIIGDGSGIHMGGDTEFLNIGVNFGSNYKHIMANGHNLSFGQGTRLVGSAIMSKFGGGGASSDYMSESNEAYTINCEIPIKYFGLTNNYSQVTHNADVTAIYNAGTGSPVFYFGTNNGKTTFNAGVNVVVKAAAGVSFDDDAYNNTVFGDNGYMQILNHTATNVTTEGSDLARVPADKLWVLNNKLQASDLFELTETKGKFKVNTEVYNNVKAVSAVDSSVVIDEENGFLILPAGVYNITASKIPQTKTYYVMADGTGDGTSVEAPLGNVGAAISKAISDGCIVGDTVNIKVMGTEVAQGAYPNYAFTLNISSNDPATRTKITLSGAIANNTTAWTNYDNVELYKSGSWNSVQLQNGNVNIGSGVKMTGSYWALVFGTGNGGGAAQSIPGQKVVYSATSAPYSLHLSNWNYANVTYTDVVELEYNVPGAAVEIHGNAAYSGAINGTTKYNAALNVNVKGATKVNFANFGGVTIGAGMQVINSAGQPVDKNHLADLPADKLYVINNVSGNNNLIEFTDTIGTYKINLDNPEHDVVAVNLDTQAQYQYDKNGTTLTLPAGYYELKVLRDPVYKDYYIDSENGISITAGTRPETAGTKQNPVKTYADATRLIAQDGLAAIDVATIYVPSGRVAEWGSSPASFDCQLIINSTMAGDPGTLQNHGGISLTGNTTLRNVILNQTYQWAGLKLADYNFTVEKDATANVQYCYIWNTGYGVKHTKDMNIRIEGTFVTNGIAMGAEYHDHTCTGDINIYYDSETSAATFLFGGGTDAKTNNIYEGNINITIKNATAFALGKRTTGADIKGSLQLLVDDSVKLPYSVKTNFDNFEVEGGKWYITNAASDDDFVDFSANKGVFTVKGGAKAYSRQFEKDQVTHTGGVIDLAAAPGAYTVSDKAIAPLTDDSHKMLYYRLAGGAHNISTRAKVTPGETYRFEYSIFTSLYEDSKPAIRDDGDRGVTCDVEIISEKKIGNYYRIVAEGTIPEDYNHGSTACFGVNLSAYSEGVIFDRTVYNANDPTKKDCYEGNQLFHDGLDYVTLDQAKFWGKILKGAGMVTWSNGFEFLEIMNFSEDFIAELIALNNPNDGEWWDEEDLNKEEAFATYADARGTFKDSDGNPVVGVKMLLKSDDASYKDTTDSKGKFNFDHILTGFYELYIIDGSEEIFTGFTAYIAQEELVEFTIVSDISALQGGDTSIEGSDSNVENDETVEGGENIEEITPPAAGGTLKGIVYSAYGDPIAKLKISLGNVGEVVTDENGSFELAGIPAGVYDLCVVKSSGEKVVIRKDIEIKDNITRSIKAQYDISLDSDSEETDNGWILWVIIASIVALVIVAGLIFLLVFKKKKIEKA